MTCEYCGLPVDQHAIDWENVDGEPIPCPGETLGALRAQLEAIEMARETRDPSLSGPATPK